MTFATLTRSAKVNSPGVAEGGLSYRWEGRGIRGFVFQTYAKCPVASPQDSSVREAHRRLLRSQPPFEPANDKHDIGPEHLV